MIKYVLVWCDTRYSEGIKSAIYDCEAELRLALGKFKCDNYGEYIEGSGKYPDLEEEGVNFLLNDGHCGVWKEEHRYGMIYYKLIEVV